MVIVHNNKLITNTPNWKFLEIMIDNTLSWKGYTDRIAPRLSQACYILRVVKSLFLFLQYTGCPRRKGTNFGRVFLRSNYKDITQNTYIQSSMVTEILAREKCGFLWCRRTVLCPWRHTHRISYVIARCIPALSLDAAHRSQCIVVGSQWTTMTRVQVFL
jgi:hypothetical protein